MLTEEQIAKLEAFPWFSWDYTKDELNWFEPAPQDGEETCLAKWLLLQKVTYWRQKATSDLERTSDELEPLQVEEVIRFLVADEEGLDSFESAWELVKLNESLEDDLRDGKIDQEYFDYLKEYTRKCFDLRKFEREFHKES